MISLYNIIEEGFINSIKNAGSTLKTVGKAALPFTPLLLGAASAGFFGANQLFGSQPVDATSNPEGLSSIGRLFGGGELGKTLTFDPSTKSDVGLLGAGLAGAGLATGIPMRLKSAATGTVRNFKQMRQQPQQQIPQYQQQLIQQPQQQMQQYHQPIQQPVQGHPVQQSRS